MKRLLWSCLLLLPLLGCGDSNSTRSSYQLSWRLGYGNYWAENPAYQFQTCANSVSGWPSSPVDKIYVRISDPEDQIRPFEELYDCASGLETAAVDLYGFDEIPWQIEMEGRRADGTALYRLLPLLVDFSQPLEDPLILHSLTGNLNFSLCFSSCAQMDCPASVERVVLELYKQDSAGNYPEKPDVTYSVACGTFLEPVQLTELNVEPVSGQQPPTYRLQAQAMDANGVALYCGTEERPVKPGVDNLRNNMVLQECQ